MSSLQDGVDEHHKQRLKPNEEWRFEVEQTAKLVFRIVEGSAEVFGTELVRGREYEFSGLNAAVFTYHGCIIEWEGTANVYVAVNSTMVRYAHIHLAIESMRQKARRDGTAPPRIMLVGPKNSGKSTIAKILVSYGVKSGNFPVLANLDPASPVFSPPGPLVAAPVSHILDIEDGFGLPAISGPAATHHKQPLVYNYGLQSPSSSPAFYLHEAKLLANGLMQRCDGDKKVRESGTIIDTPASFSELDGEEAVNELVQTIEMFEVNAVLIVGKECLKSRLEKLLADQPKSETSSELVNAIYYIPSSGGETADNDAFMRQMQRRAISQYFFGNSRLVLSPFTVTTSLKDITVFRPLEQKEITTESHTFLTKIEPSSVLQNCLLAVVNALPTDSLETIADAETLGYVHVVEADDARQILKMLLPVPGKVPRKALIMGDYRYVE